MNQFVGSLPGVLATEITSFSPGSIVVDYELTLASDSPTTIATINNAMTAYQEYSSSTGGVVMFPRSGTVAFTDDRKYYVIFQLLHEVLLTFKVSHHPTLKLTGVMYLLSGQYCSPTTDSKAGQTRSVVSLHLR